MTDREIKEAEERATKYRALEKVRDEIYAAIKAITEPWPNGPCGANPFTGNWRESRQVRSMSILFTCTRGGEPDTGTEISHMHIEASDLGRALEGMLRAKLKVVNEEMEKI